MHAANLHIAAEPRASRDQTPRDSVHPENVPSLTGLRFLAAFSVLLAHSAAVLLRDYETPGNVVYWIKQTSGFGMTLFFVLSGFVIHYNYSATASRSLRDVGRFLWARFARLYPLFLLMLAVSLLLSIKPFHMLRGDTRAFYSTLEALPFFLLSIQSWLYLPIGENSLVYAIGGSASLSWSISTEWFFYLIYPMVALLILRSWNVKLTFGAILLWGLLWIAFCVSLFDRAASINDWAVAHFGPIAEMREPQDNFAAQDSFVRWLLYFSPYLRMGEFVLGSLVAQLYVQCRSRKVSDNENLLGTAALLLGAASMVLITYLEYSPRMGANIFRAMYMNFALAPSAALVIFSAARYRNPISRWLNRRAAIILGDASYSIYLLHFGVLIAVFWLTGTQGVGLQILKFALVVPVTIVASIGLYRYYEAPCRRLLRDLWAWR